MTMRKPTQAQVIAEIKTILENRKNRIVWLHTLLGQNPSKNDLEWIKAELKEHEKWIKDAEKKIKDFYAPAMVI